jgi:RNA polymerase sigma factor (sigma-70 family)
VYLDIILRMAQIDKYLELSDQEVIEKIKDNNDALGIVYKRCKTNSLGFLRRMNTGKTPDDELHDVFQDAILNLYEKIVKGDFVLTCKLQTYMNQVCKFQLLSKIKKSKLTITFEENIGYDDEDGITLSYDVSITDTLDEIEDTKEAQFMALESALEIMKTAGGRCYELLTFFWYQRKSMNELTEIFGYSDADNTKNQKARCQKRLKDIVFNELNN